MAYANMLNLGYLRFCADVGLLGAFRHFSRLNLAFILCSILSSLCNGLHTLHYNEYTYQIQLLSWIQNSTASRNEK